MGRAKAIAGGGAVLAPTSASEGLRIEDRPLDTLIPYARNARTHSDAQVALIAGSIREFGFTNPVLVDGANGIIAGHGRVLAARKPCCRTRSGLCRCGHPALAGILWA